MNTSNTIDTSNTMDTLNTIDTSNTMYILSATDTSDTMDTLINILIVILALVPTLLAIAFTTVAERKSMASMQRRVGPNIVGYYGLLQAFADALKLLLKEYVAPTQADIILFFLGPLITLICSLLGYAIIPYGPGLTVGDLPLGILYLLAVSSLSTYGILLAGWSANSKYAFLGSLRSTAQLISYELILSSAILLVLVLSGNLSLIGNIEAQKGVLFFAPLLPIFIMFFIGSIAETNRPPFDLAEAESELVSGFMTEHSAAIFVFFFLAEYGSILLICIFNSILFLGGYLNPISYDALQQMADADDMANVLIQALIFSVNLGLKSSLLVFGFILVRASFPRIRFDQLMSYCWTILLPIMVGYICLLPSGGVVLHVIPTNFFVL